jgi:hypothetical protein
MTSWLLVFFRIIWRRLKTEKQAKYFKVIIFFILYIMEENSSNVPNQ